MMTKSELNIQNRNCIIYSTENPEYLLIQPTGEHELKSLDNEVDIIAQSGRKFIFASFQIKNWSDELSPWKAKQAFGDEFFGDGGKNTLTYIKESLLPELKNLFDLTNCKIILGGYSLAGLFSMWSAYQTDIFFGVSACSPSLWIDNWTEFSENNDVKTKNVYLSIGNREHKTRNQMMQKSKEKVSCQFEFLKSKNINSVFEINSGNHFVDCDLRTAKGFIWCMNQN